jgi:hypothetical protein
MVKATRTAATARASCGNRAQPGVTRITAALDWSRQATTPDQRCIEAVLDMHVGTGTSLLHVGVGNAQLAQRFARRAQRLDGLTLHPQEQIHAAALGLPHDTVAVHNTYSPTLETVLTPPYDWIIDNNLAAFACCQSHFLVMWATYLRVLAPQGQIVTCQLGMDAYQADGGWAMTSADLVSLERRFSIRVSPLTGLVYAIALLPSPRQGDAA